MDRSANEIFRALFPVLFAVAILWGGCSSGSDETPPPNDSSSTTGQPKERLSQGEQQIFQMFVVRSDDRIDLPRLSVGRTRFAVDDTAALDAGDLAGVVAAKSDTGAPVLRVTFNPQGAERLAKVREKNAGRKVVVMIFGQSLTAPALDSVVHDGPTMVLRGFQTHGEAEVVAEEINNVIEKK